MTITTRHPVLRWLAPAAVIAVVAGAAVVGHAVASGVGTASLPAVTVTQLLADIEQADVAGVSGTVVESADLGLPSLPQFGPSGPDSGLLGLVTGTHTLRVWYGGPTKQRVALLNSMGESDIIRNGQDLWTWDSSDNSATHRTLPAGAHPGLTGGAPESVVPVDPQQAAQTALALIGKTTTVTVDNSTVVAGRAAYELVLSPKGTGSLIRSVRIAVDGSTHVPLRVEIDSVKTTTPAFSVGFTSVDFGQPDNAEFSFTPPPGTTVNGDNTAAAGVLHGLPSLTNPAVVGSGWTTVLVADQSTTRGAAKPNPGQVVECSPGKGPAPTSSPTAAPLSKATPPPSGAPKRRDCISAGDGNDLGSMLGRVAGALPQASGAWGTGRVLTGTLFTVVITDDGRIAVGAVTPDVVFAALIRR
jgi:outer membrane lipoprotein-sorting protein